MVVPARRVATYADVLAAPEHMVAELMAGELHVQPRPAGPHTVASSLLGSVLTGAFWRGVGGPGGWILLDEPELHLGDEVMVPDMAGWLQTSAAMGELQKAYFTTPPRWVLEVLSPATAQKDRVLKLPRYHAAGVQFAWLLDPLAQTLEVYRRAAEGWLQVAVHGGKSQVRAEPFEAIELDLGELWPWAEDDATAADRSDTSS